MITRRVRYWWVIVDLYVNLKINRMTVERDDVKRRQQSYKSDVSLTRSNELITYIRSVDTNEIISKIIYLLSEYYSNTEQKKYIRLQTYGYKYII